MCFLISPFLNVARIYDQFAMAEPSSNFDDAVRHPKRTTICNLLVENIDRKQQKIGDRYIG